MTMIGRGKNCVGRDLQEWDVMTIVAYSYRSGYLMGTTDSPM